eukprot:COSAG02_NODE_1658_length_11466_cov_36.222046_2_plen_342_part_00
MDHCCWTSPKNTISSPVFDEVADKPGGGLKCTCLETNCASNVPSGAASRALTSTLDGIALGDLTALWASVSERGPAWLDGSPMLESPRGKQLHDEMHFLATKQGTERAQTYADCPTYDNFLRSIQLDMLSPAHRRSVFEWNIEMADLLKLSNQALLLAFTYFDRYLSLIPCRLKDLQLLSTACMWVASKVCSTECLVATSTQLASLYSDVDAKDITRMERKLFEVLKWRVHPTMPYDIVQLIIPCMSCDHPSLQLKINHLTDGILLSMALVYPMLRFDALVQAATSVVCACELVAGVSLDDLGILDHVVALVGADKQATVECLSVLRENVRLQQLCPDTRE